MTEEEHFITIKENPLYNYTNVIDKIKTNIITKLVRKQQYPNTRYRLRREISKGHYKFTDEYVDVINSYQILWIKLTEQEAKEILGATDPPIFKNYLIDLRKYWGRSFMSYGNVPMVWILEIEYVKKPIQKVLM